MVSASVRKRRFASYLGGGVIALPSAPTNSAVPTITGASTAEVGIALTATNGTWAGNPAPTFTRQWQRGDAAAGPFTAISGATGATYTPVVADAGKYLRVVVTATNSEGTATANSTATAAVRRDPANTVAPAVTGTATVGQTLTASNGTWTGTPTPTYTRKWQRSADGTTGWADIASATATTYVLAAADEGQYVRAVVTGTNTAGTASANSNAVGPVAGA